MEKTDYDEYKLNSSEKTKFYILGYAAAVVVAYVFFKAVIPAFVLGFSIVFFRRFYEGYLGDTRKRLLITQFKDLLYSLSASMAAGHSMETSLKEGLESLKSLYAEDTPLINELKYILDGMRESGDNEANLLSDFALRSHCEDIRNFVDVYTISRSSGGDMEKIIGRAAEILLDKLSIKKEIDTLMSQKRLEGKIITAMPIIMVAGLNTISPGYLNLLYTTIAGRIIMLFSLGGIIFAYILMHRLTDIGV